MSAWCVEVTWRDYADGEESTSLYGPFRSPDTAAKHAEKIETARSRTRGTLARSAWWRDRWASL
jgi:hypothetical protein